MGDWRAVTLLGSPVAVATLLATYAGGTRASRPTRSLAPLCVMAVPLYDMTSVIWIRLRAGKSPFEADRNHFSHRLVDLGLTKTQAVLTIYLTSATCGLGALLLHQVNLFGAGVIVLLVICVLLLLAILETTARRKLSRSSESNLDRVNKRRQKNRQGERSPRGAARAIDDRIAFSLVVAWGDGSVAGRNTNDSQ